METVIGIVAGFLGGVVVTFIGQRYFTPRDRSKDLMAEALGDLLAGIHLNVMGKSVLAAASPDAQLVNELKSGSQILRANIILATLGTPEIEQAVEACDRSGQQMGEPASRDALVELIQATRRAVAPHRGPIPNSLLRELLFFQQEGE